jgi:flagellar protein FlaI
MREEKTRARQMIEILRRQNEEIKEVKREKCSEPVKKKRKKFRLRGILYRKLKKEEIPKTRIGKMLRMRKKSSEYPKFRVFPSKRLISLAPMNEVKNKEMLYPLIKPYAYANIRWSAIDNSLNYHVVEPELSSKEKEILEKLKEGMIQVINISLRDVRSESVMDFLEENIQKLLDDYGFEISEQGYFKIMYYIFRDFIGLNEIEPLLRDPYIEDIGLDGLNIPIYVVHQKYGSLKTNIVYNNLDKLKEFVTKLAERCDRYISYAEPLFEGTLPDGTRVHASFAGDVTTRGPTFSIRKFKETPFTPVDMVKMNTASPEMLAYLWFVVENGANILITGGVATGKTTLLNCLSLFIPTEAKIVSIEDTRELSLPHENWVPGVARTGFTPTGIGEITMFELLKESFRQNPDYLIVGEVRGKEAYVMFQSMASGHPSMSTMHAGSVDDLMRRLQTEPIGLSPGLLEILDIIIVMVHAREKGKSARRVKEILEMESVDVESGKPRTSKSFVWNPFEDSFEYKGSSWSLSKISAEKGLEMSNIIKDISNRKKVILWMVENNITDVDEIVKYINLYRKSPNKIEEIIRR